MENDTGYSKDYDDGTGYSKNYHAIKIRVESEQELIERIGIACAPSDAFDFIDKECGGECDGE